ncbi:MAG: NAD(P)-dependent oxidoreductase [Rhodospirillaceae bacterium]|nr:NAD(P)-dependent oxidoreductase [Rhodospirillaceae bacterium]MBT6138374.1 NAD(P)-dependent oxidoreductase [Rhodospirillaceae bacterium]
MSKMSFGFVGLGNMGSQMAGRLLQAGHSLVVYDRVAATTAAMVNKGAVSAKSAADVASKVDVVFLALPTPDVVKAVILGAEGLVEGAKAKSDQASVVVDLSTTGPRVTLEIAEALAGSDVTLIDCPVSGGIAGAVAGTLALMASGDRKTIDGLAPALAEIGKLFIVGDKTGQGQTLKVINNLISTAALTISSEAMVLGAKAGLDPDLMIEVINAGSGRNTATTDKIPNFMLSRSFDFGMTIGLSSKDARLCLEESDRLGVPMIVGTAVRQLLNITRDQFGPDADMTEVIRTVEQWADVEVVGAAANQRKPT